MIITIVVFIVILSLLVFVHELGHFAVSRRFGATVEEFGFGLPPRVFGIRKLNGHWQIIWGRGKNNQDLNQEGPTIYSLNWIPIGGFVKIKGENGEVEVSQIDPKSFVAKPIWQRTAILVAGVTMNFILCVILLIIGFNIGMPSVVDGPIKGQVVSMGYLQVLSVIDGTPAESAGVKPGDIILRVNGQTFKDYAELSSYLSGLKDQKAEFTFKRGIEDINQQIEVKEYQNTVGIGVAIFQTAVIRYPWYQAIWLGIKTSFIWLFTIVVALAILLKNLVVGSPTGVEVAGPVGIAVLTSQATKMGIVYLIQFTALLSLNLAIVNILPLPALDGGRILFLIIEKLRGRAMKQKWENLSHNIGFLLLMLLVVFVTYRDIAKYGGKIVSVLKKSVGL